MRIQNVPRQQEKIPSTFDKQKVAKIAALVLFVIGFILLVIGYIGTINAASGTPWKGLSLNGAAVLVGLGAAIPFVATFILGIHLRPKIECYVHQNRLYYKVGSKVFSDELQMRACYPNFANFLAANYANKVEPGRF